MGEIYLPKLRTPPMKQVFPSCLLAILLFHVGMTQSDDNLIYGKFPDNFIWGLSTASYQIEGGWNADGKGENIWDNFTHRQPSPIFDGSNGDIACNSYFKYEEDVQLLKEIGAKAYRFSLSWSRLLPTGTLAVVNHPGVNYYNKLIDLLLKNGIQPVITLYHWDLPQNLQETTGGWISEDMIDHFVNYAGFAFDTFGDRVKTWLTFNEPWTSCLLSYGEGLFAPGIRDTEEGAYKCVDVIIKSHGKAYRLFDSKFRKSGSKLGIVIDSPWYEPLNPKNPKDVEASERAMLFKHGMFGYPLTFGKYPDVVRDYIDWKSENKQIERVRLPEFTQEWVSIIKGSYDFLGLNHYSTELVEATPDSWEPGWYGDQDIKTSQDESWPGSASDWLKVVPWGFKKTLKWIKETYGNPEVIVTENGFSDPQTGGTEDNQRLSYFRQYTNVLLQAIKEFGVNVKGYFAWSLLDNFEWQRGYSERFGVHWVNFSDPNRQRIPKTSALFLKKLFRQNGFFEDSGDKTEL